MASILSMIFIILEAVIEAFIPFITADLINSIDKDTIEMSYILKTGLLLVIMAIISLTCAGIAGYASAKASAGFAKNLRHDLFHKIQSYSFENIDKFSSTSLVTRLTTDVANAQMAFMMIIRGRQTRPLICSDSSLPCRSSHNH